MRRSLATLGIAVLVAALGWVTPAVRAASGSLRVTIEPYGPDGVTVSNAVAAAVASPAAQAYLAGTRNRLLGWTFPDPVKPERPGAFPAPPDRFEATVYDYTDARTVLVDAAIANPEGATAAVSDLEPPSSFEEFQEAVRVVAADPELGPLIDSGRLVPMRPMPAVGSAHGATGAPHRVVFVGLVSGPDAGLDSRLVGVDMVTQSVSQSSAVAILGCGPFSANQKTTVFGTAGDAVITIKNGQGTTLWQFLVVRPAASSGYYIGSGIELYGVQYKGQSVLWQAHAPIVNVRYDNDSYGPFRDWTYEEGAFQAATKNGETEGIAQTTSAPKTIVESGVDKGNFRGVAVFSSGNEVTLTSELEAGWYRYESQWRFAADGTISSRWGFAATRNWATCSLHIHHVYWRYDFDVHRLDDNVMSRVTWHSVPALRTPFETKSIEVEAHRASSQDVWRVESASGGAWDVVPGISDGTADLYGVADMWALRYHAGQDADGHRPSDSNICMPADITCLWMQTTADITQFVTGENVYQQDVVLWYGAHFVHDISTPEPHVVGPDIQPVVFKPHRPIPRDQLEAYTGMDNLATIVMHEPISGSATFHQVTGVDGGRMPVAFLLQPGRPNPVVDRTVLEFSLPRGGKTTLGVFDVRGRVIATLVNEDLGPGNYRKEWFARDSQGRAVTSGVYYLKLQNESDVRLRRIVVVR